ncbi:hypothetical protein M885DRAFT_564922 [Pelagophyceae sp. CCMP2097]|nr:hypothetical protein M885DRAFT_564922 [Pelagophyceae sp. CCMP2097]
MRLSVLARLAVVCLARAGAAGVTWDEAKCILAGRRAVWVGDSISRFCFYAMNHFLDTGFERPRFTDPGDDVWGEGNGSHDYDGGEGEPWTEFYRFSQNPTHRQHFFKDFDFGGRTEFNFMQNVWTDSGQTGGFVAATDLQLHLADVVVYNGGWWFLVDDDDYMGTGEPMHCGEVFDDRCAEEYSRMVTATVEQIFVEALLSSKPKALIWRTSTCCSKSDSAAASADWVPPLEAENTVVRKVLAKHGLADHLVDVFPLYDEMTVNDVTFDGKHPQPADAKADARADAKADDRADAKADDRADA